MFDFCYVDDTNMATWALPPGTRVKGGKLTILQEHVEEDWLVPEDRRTASIIREVANQISGMIQVKEDVPSNHPTGKLPILDLEVWVQGNQLVHSFYKKPVSSRRVICAKSALPTAVKRSILLEEGSRRLRNCSPNLPWGDKVIHLNRLSSDMKNSGHTANFRKLVLRRILAKYAKSLSNHLEEVWPMYRSRQERDQQQRTAGMFNRKDTWFRRGGATSTLSVPPTPGRGLAQMVEEKLKEGRQPDGTRTKVVESNGVSASMGMVKANQFPRGVCHRQDCVVCFQKDGSSESTFCDRSSVGYEGDCLRCTESVCKYVGETSRTGYTRTKEHLSDYRAASAAKLPPLPRSDCGTAPDKRNAVKSWMWEHTRDVHGGQVGEREGVGDYRFKVTNKFKKCLERQVNEDIRMQHHKKDGCTLLNSKNEWYTPKSVEPVFKQY